MWSRRRKVRFNKILVKAVRISSGAAILFLLIFALSRFSHFYTDQFPVTVNPHQKTINENPGVNILLASKYSLFRGGGAEEATEMQSIIGRLMTVVRSTSETASISNAGGHFVVIKPGMRKEQVASAFAKVLGWNSEEKRQFSTPLPNALLPFKEGTFLPGTYFVTSDMTPLDVQKLVNDRFTKEVLDNYGASTERIVPLKDALIIASIIQRETIGTDGMRLVSGIIWNRLFTNMNLQIDATLQYSKASNGQSSTWWPQVFSYDKYIYSPFNTYMHGGLPPEPIANPSVAAIIAALNPIETPCIFYFNDPKGNFHCSTTYEEHRKLLKKHY